MSEPEHYQKGKHQYIKWDKKTKQVKTMKPGAAAPADRPIEAGLDDPESCGVYGNLVRVSHSENEFVLDFIFQPPHAEKAKVRSRVLLHPLNVKRLYLALGEHLKKYEEKFGARR